MSPHHNLLLLDECQVEAKVLIRSRSKSRGEIGPFLTPPVEAGAAPCTPQRFVAEWCPPWASASAHRTSAPSSRGRWEAPGLSMGTQGGVTTAHRLLTAAFSDQGSRLASQDQPARLCGFLSTRSTLPYPPPVRAAPGPVGSAGAASCLPLGRGVDGAAPGQA